MTRAFLCYHWQERRAATWVQPSAEWGSRRISCPVTSMTPVLVESHAEAAGYFLDTAQRKIVVMPYPPTSGKGRGGWL